MTGEFSFFGMYFPWLMLTSLLALVATRLISIFLARIGFYRYVWHPPLFDVALFLVVLGIFVVLFNFGRS
ncbi:DUF1656 domain-containing protein [Oxalobacter aliiformigenes]|jgi:hypothetical protein|uniref:DUF1656 domain-containing protein n=1 Tax=Oxalobacter aliiformigenes TaxID=2946593 RepID=A0A9E9NXB6_9BURK|nr:DUF1656 domain-containing protein [Oxalobacter aliiformigenes]MCZ4064500.1 DUF1656 domain-containing protein [Oxalobacter aliiformigenes]WAV88666.1 DUF1656 domain-containing protein [Oxalobacter aliiformigenes]WAV90694.1 DUF1656 domain-containing protein [Oxalobacter aliiformigenes]WAV92734.1 DUF1656 domain-containing protein [Oxalobacter aliiformigenes]WAV95760.1 DUF1656 domain-containing protein [Oxalobacter aliiformigenes]